MGVKISSRSHRARDQHRAAGGVGDLAGEAGRRAEFSSAAHLRAVQGEAIAVAAEAVGQDQIGAGIDEALVNRPDAIGMLDVSPSQAPPPSSPSANRLVPMAPSATTTGWRASRSVRGSAMVPGSASSVGSRAATPAPPRPAVDSTGAPGGAAARPQALHDDQALRLAGARPDRDLVEHAHAARDRPVPGSIPPTQEKGSLLPA